MEIQSKQGIFSPFLQKRRMLAVLPFIKGNVLDVGCGDGNILKLKKINNYYGYDTSEIVIDYAKNNIKNGIFHNKLPPINIKFDTILCLAVIEHVPDPEMFINNLSSYLRNNDSRIIITTPNPKFHNIHHYGAMIGFFSKDADEEHQELIGKIKLKEIASKNKLKLFFFKKFLLGANQLAIFTKA